MVIPLKGLPAYPPCEVHGNKHAQVREPVLWRQVLVISMVLEEVYQEIRELEIFRVHWLLHALIDLPRRGQLAVVIRAAEVLVVLPDVSEGDLDLGLV